MQEAPTSPSPLEPSCIFRTLADFFYHIIERGHDDVLVIDLRCSCGVESLDLDLTRDSPQRSPQKVC
jgi:hypothetical protein